MSIQRVTFLVPPFPGRKIREMAGLPLGVIYLAAGINNSYDTHLVDAYSPPLSVETLLAEIISSEPDVLAVSTPFSAQMAKMREILPGIREHLPGCIIIGGGPHVSFTVERTFRDFPEYDYIVLGDGELVFPALLDELGDPAFIKRETRLQTGNVAYVIGDEVIVGELAIGPTELDSLPLPDYSLLEDARNYTPRIMTSRGCSHRCHFCSSSAFNNGKWRAHSAERVIEEFGRIESIFGDLPISIGDDNFTADRNRVLSMCDLLRKRGQKQKFGISAHPDDLDPDLLEELASAGLNSLFLGLESGVVRIREMVGKVFNEDDLHTNLDTCTKNDIDVHASFMLGIPGEMEEDMRKTLSFAEGIKATTLGFHIFNPLPGSAMYNRPEDFGYEIENDDYEDMAIDTRCRIKTPYLQSIAVLDYYYRARGIARVRVEEDEVSG